MVSERIKKAVPHFSYDPKTGNLYKIEKDKGLTLVSNKSSRGYIRGNLRGAHFFAHRMAWRLHYGEWPDKPIDHINGDKADNRISNLRLVSESQNQQNRHAVRGVSRFKGVCLNKRCGKWQAAVQSGGKYNYLGLFESEEEAAAAYNHAAKKMFGEFSKLNDIGV